MRVCTCRLEILARARFHGRQANSEWAHSNVCVRNALSTNSADWCAGTHAICAYYYCPPPIRPSSYRYYDRIQLHLNTLLACSVLPSFPGPCSRALFVQLEAGVCVCVEQTGEHIVMHCLHSSIDSDRAPHRYMVGRCGAVSVTNLFAVSPRAAPVPT